MQYFKVVRKAKDGKYVSAFASGMSSVEYGVGLLSSPPDWLEGTEFGLTVFDSLKEAVEYKSTMEFMDYKNDTFTVFRVSVEFPVRTPPGQVMSSSNMASGLLIRQAGRWPEGTVMTNGVILLEEVA